MKKNKKFILIVGAILFSGCAQNLATLEEATAEANSLILTPNKFKNSHYNKKVKSGWLKTFKDPTLNYLVKEAQKNNPDLKIASANVAQALAYMNMSIANLSPTMDLVGSYQFRNYQVNKQHDIGNGVLSVSWEPDLWGKVANEVESQRENTLLQYYMYEWAKESLAANTAKAWFLLGADRMIIDFYKQVVKIQKDANTILKKRANIGQGNLRDVAVSAGMLAEAREALLKAKQSYKQDIRALEVLVGRYPAGKLKGKYLKLHLPNVPTGIPLSLLDRRPDIIAAKYQVASTFHNKEATKLLRLPSIKIGGQVGVDVVRDAIAKAIGGLFMPIFDAGKIQAKIDAASAKEQKAIANYKKVVLNAYKEVENALSNERYLQKRYVYLNKMVKEYKKAYDMTYKNYKIGQGNILDVLNIQSKWISAKIARTQLLKERLINRVNLFLALGGKY